MYTSYGVYVSIHT